MALIMDEEELPYLNDNNDTRKSILSETFSLNYISTLSVFYFIILVTGVLANISICIAIGRNRSLHTPTNLYLMNLSISNTFLLISGLPLEMYRLWNRFTHLLGEELCTTMKLMSETATNVTALTIVMVTIERYIAVCHPFMSHNMSKLSRVMLYIIGIWTCALCFAVPQVMEFGKVTYEKKEPIDNICTVKGHRVQMVIDLLSFIVFVVHVSFITVLYVLIGLKLHTSRVLHLVEKSSESRERAISTLRFNRDASQRKVIRMLVAVVVSYFLCLAPIKIQNLIAFLGKNLNQPTNTIYKVNLILTYLSDVLYFLSAATNPFLCYIMSNKFRNAFKVTLEYWCRLRNRPRLERTYTAELESQKKHVEAGALQHSPHPRRRHLVAASSEMRDRQPLPQSLNRNNFTVVNIENEPKVWRQQLAAGSDSLTSPQSISNSSLRELDQEENKEELAIYLYQVNCEIIGETRDPTA